MVRFHMEIDDTELVQATERLSSALDRELHEALDQAVKWGAEKARSEHAFKNRSGSLEASIEGTTPVGKFSDDTLQASVSAGEDYASFVEAKKPFLEPLRKKINTELGRRAKSALDRAANRAGW